MNSPSIFCAEIVGLAVTFDRSIDRSIDTVEPLYNGHPGAELTGRCREVAVAGRFLNKSEKYG